MFGIRGPFITIPNILSIIRGFLIIPLLFYFLKGDSISVSIAIFLGIIMILTDVFDGYIARKTNSVSEWGKILDPLADKFCILFVAIIGVIYREFPLYAAIIIIGRDVFIVLISLVLFKKLKTAQASHPIGKYTALITSLSLLAYFLKLDSFKEYILALALILVAISGLYYFIRAFRELSRG
ncbi:MAG: hypothetical protein GY855_14555 [candidate division Zixibacteria bacterium]|nr:hypothetical protein [candidate division Zixibacteria bacterium]